MSDSWDFSLFYVLFYLIAEEHTLEIGKIRTNAATYGRSTINPMINTVLPSIDALFVELYTKSERNMSCTLLVMKKIDDPISPERRRVGRRVLYKQRDP